MHYDTDNPTTLTVLYCEFNQVWSGYQVKDGTTGQTCPDDIKGGGAIFVDRTNLDCRSSVFTACKATSGFGGAILSKTGSSLTITECHFTDCSSEPEYCHQTSGGRAVATMERMMTVTKC